MSHDILISKISGTSLPPAITRWMSCYLRGRQAVTSFRCNKSSTSIVRTGVPPVSKLSPSLFNYYITNMPRPTPPFKRVCYLGHITWTKNPTAGVHDQQLPERCKYISEGNSLLISELKSTVTLFTPDKHQFQTHPDITLEDTHLLLDHRHEILGMIMDPSLSFHKHCNYVSDRID